MSKIKVLASAILKEVPLWQTHIILTRHISFGDNMSGDLCGIGCPTGGDWCGLGCPDHRPGSGVIDPDGQLGLTREDLHEIKSDIGRLKIELSNELETYATEIRKLNVKSK